MRPLASSARHVDLWLARGLTLGPVALAFPVLALAVLLTLGDLSGRAEEVAC